MNPPVMTYLQCKRPRGAPEIGELIVVWLPMADKCQHGTVSAWLSTQFVITLADGSDRVVRTDAEFETIGVANNA